MFFLPKKLWNELFCGGGVLVPAQQDTAGMEPKSWNIWCSTRSDGSSCQICLGSLGKRRLCCPSVESQMLVPGCRSSFSSHSLYSIPQGGEMRLWNSGMFGAGCCCRQCCSRLLGLVNGIGVVRSCSFCHCSFSFRTPQARSPARHSPLTAGESAAPGSHPDTDP